MYLECNQSKLPSPQISTNTCSFYFHVLFYLLNYLHTSVSDACRSRGNQPVATPLEYVPCFPNAHLLSIALPVHWATYPSFIDDGVSDWNDAVQSCEGNQSCC